jgi:hypothetical protein
MNFPSIDIQGSILSTDLLSKIRSEQATFQSGKDFRPDFTTAKLKDEISFAWQEAKGQWTIYKSKLARLRSGELGTTETRNFWISPLLTNLGYNLTFNRQAEDLNGKSFSIGYRDTTLDGFPIYAGGYHESLDKRPENKQIRMSPHALIQEYLNYSEHLYGIVTNGRQLRLLRDASRITRLSYVEFNLEKMMEEDLYSDFVLLYRLLHASRMPKTAGTGPDSIIEKYHQEGLEAGSTIRNKLGSAVKKAILDLSNAFINHPNNEELRDVVKSDKFNLDEYYKLQLRIIYRLLFLFVIEERNLVYGDSKTPETKRFNEIYFSHFSLIRFRRIAKKLAPPESNRHFDLWRSLIGTFALFEKKEIGEKLGIMSLQGDLFSYKSLTTSQYNLHECDVSNAVILNIIRSLTYFENDNQVSIAVNYGGLDVEEFGSVYEGLLELRLVVTKVEGSELFSFSFDASGERGKSGSHYTPEELVQPLIANSLNYLIADSLKEKDPATSLLSLKVADVACGSGHILLSAARRIAHELASIFETNESGNKDKVEQPSPVYLRRAMKQVVRNCIYGVDKNPLAVELCKVALWLEAYNPGEPLNFLDHHIKCGDAIVGLAYRYELENGISNAAFRTLPSDDKDTAKAWRDRNSKERKDREAKALQLKADFEKVTENSVQESMAEYRSFNLLPESTPEQIDRKAKAYQKFIDGKGFTFLKSMADTQVAQFFIPKTRENSDYLMSDADFRMILSGYNKSWQDRKVAKATTVSQQLEFFHWFLEFPEVFQNGGFDCILGNPPFLGGKKISGSYGDHYLSFLKYYYIPSEGGVDLVGYFFRRIHKIIKQKGFQSLISTNTISQGDTRKASLDFICSNDGSINFAVKSRKWPGVAALEISLVSIFKGIWNGKRFLNTNEVTSITSFLDDNESNLQSPFPLSINAKKSFQGTIVLGTGFILEPNEATSMIENNNANKSVIFPYLNGDDLNSTYDIKATRYIINFFDWSEEYCKTNYPECYSIVEKRVKPQRIILKDKGYREKWWQYGRRAVDMYESIKNKPKVLVVAQVTKPLAFEFVESDQVLDAKLIVFDLDTFASFAVMQSSMHNSWCWNYCTTLETRLSYAPTSLFETFPFPLGSEIQSLETIGKEYYLLRKQLMSQIKLGLTKVYNLFHSKAVSEQGLDTKDKQLMALQKHLEKFGLESELRDVTRLILQLRSLHVKMDEAVLSAYSWTDIALKHNLYEVDFLPEDDRIRFTIHPIARKELLKRLLQLNHKIHADEKATGLWDSKKINIKRSKSENGGQVNEADVGYGSLFK